MNVPGGNGLLSVPGDDCHDAGSFSDASFLSDGGYASDASANLFDQKETSSDLKKSRIKSKMRLRRSKQEYENFELASRQVLGVVFIEIVSCEDLPPYKILLVHLLIWIPLWLLVLVRKLLELAGKDIL